MEARALALRAQSEAVVTIASCCSEPVFAVCVPTCPQTDNIGRLGHVSMALSPHVYMQNRRSKKRNSTLNTLLFQIKFLKFKEHLVINHREREQLNQRESIGA